MKSIKNSFYKNLTFIKLLNAYNKTKKGKTYTNEVLEFFLNYEVNLINLKSKIAMFQYKINNYKSFIIYEPKKRIIRCLPFVDRIVQTWYVEEFIKPFYVPRFIYDSYACLENKGTHKAILRLKYFMNSIKEDSFYIIKFDISKFFDSIDKNILYNVIKHHIKDKYLLKFTYDLIYSYEYFGLPIGNYTSQYFANIYLNELDYYIKYNLKIKYYVRYMDDFIILAKDKTEARYYYNLIEIFLNNKLNLKLNPKSKYFPHTKGCPFLGFIVYKDYVLLNNKTKRKIYKKVKIWNNLYSKNILDKNKFTLSFNSYLGHISHCNSMGLKNNINKKLNF